MSKKKFLNKLTPLIVNLKLENLETFLIFYSENCKFSDPFHSTVGKKNIKKIYTTMFKNLVNPQFSEIKALSSETGVVIKWVFSFKKSSNSLLIKIPGVSWLSLDNEDLIVEHEDLWDASEFLAAFFPLNLPINWAKSKIKKNL